MTLRASYSSGMTLLVLPLLCLSTNFAVAQSPERAIRPEVFVIEVLDAETKRGVPLVELETIAHNRFVSDSAGRIAVSEPDLMDRQVYFHVRSHGYQFPKDGFGLQGKKLSVVGGQKATLTLERLNLAERLYRSTGSGIFIDSVQAGLMDRDELKLPGEVVGCDSVMTAIYQDKLYWFWGDTNRPHYPLGGNFHITGATTAKELGATIEYPPRYDYFVDDQLAVRSVAKMPGDGPTWISAVTVLPGEGTKPNRMLANFVKVRNQLDAYRWGFVAWDDKSQQFQELNSADKLPEMFPPSQVHTFVHADQGEPYVYFCHPLPLTRVKAVESAFIDPTQYEGYSCLKEGTRPADRQIERDANGQLKFGWKRNTLPLTQKEERGLIEAKAIKADEARLILKDSKSDRRVLAHSGTVSWNEYRQRWIMIAVEMFGKNSMLGDVWYAEAKAPEGPWPVAHKIVSHDEYSFYNPKHHAYFDADGGRTIYFEGTYTTTFSGNKYPTARYDYNQVMYKLDLSRVSDQLLSSP